MGTRFIGLRGGGRTGAANSNFGLVETMTGTMLTSVARVLSSVERVLTSVTSVLTSVACVLPLPSGPEGSLLMSASKSASS